jgi:hypothetical protein
MKTITCSALLLLGILAAPSPVHAGRISEPGTTFYGRVVSRAGDLEFPVTSGELKWTIAVPAQNNREYTLTAALQPLGDGLYSYKLTFPHQALAFDLAVAPNSLPLTTAGWRMRHLKVLVNGQEATLAAPATDEFTARQAARAATYRVDLILTQSSIDSDGDGLPDWWEEQTGTDKWNPNDGKPPQIAPGDNSIKSTSFTGHTFAEWREFHFPGATGSLETFAMEDPDHDGVSNLFEYAFDLNPLVASDEKATHLPRPQAVEGRPGISFHRRTDVTDLTYQIDLSEDLVQWTSNPEALVEASVAGAAPGQSCIAVRSFDKNMMFLRVRVGLKP